MRRQFRVTPSEITETVPWIETKEKSEARRPYRIGKRSDAEFLVITFTVPVWGAKSPETRSLQSAWTISAPPPPLIVPLRSFFSIDSFYAFL